MCAFQGDSRSSSSCSGRGDPSQTVSLKQQQPVSQEQVPVSCPALSLDFRLNEWFAWLLTSYGSACWQVEHVANDAV